MHQRRDFHLKQIPVKSLDCQDLYASGWRPFPEVYGEDLTERLCALLRDSPDFRVGLIVECRQASWWVRNNRWAQGEELWTHVALLIETDELMQLAGFPADDRVALFNCLFSACVCDGCDLTNGARFGEGFHC